MPAISQLLCEGFHDRAFWTGMIEKLGFMDARGRVAVDNWGDRPKQLGRGIHEFVKSSDASQQLQVVPCRSDGGVKQMIDVVLQRAPTQPIAHLLVSIDADRYDGDKTRALQSIETKLGKRVEATSTAGVWQFKQSEARAFGIIAWQAGAQAIGVPSQQCLERVVCSALAAAYPERARHVAAWLAGRPDKPNKHEAKSHAWSYMAGWCADEGIEYFLKSLWSDGRVVPHLIDALRGSNALEALHAVTGVDPNSLASRVTSP